MHMTISEFQQRRAALMQNMEAGIAIIPTAAEAVRNRDSHYPYRFDSYFYYLSGFKEPEALIVLTAGDAPKSILFCRDKDIEREIWDGFRYGPAAAVREFGFDEAYSIAQLDDMLPKLMANQPKVYFALGADVVWDNKLTQWLNQVKSQARSGVSAPDEIVDVRKLLDEMRLYKTPAEQALMRRSANIAASAHQRAMQKCMVENGI